MLGTYSVKEKTSVKIIFSINALALPI